MPKYLRYFFAGLGLTALCILGILPLSAALVGHDTSGYAPGELLVRFRSGTPWHAAMAARSLSGAAVVNDPRQVKVDRIRLPKGASVEQAVQAYASNPDVEFVEPNYRREIFMVPNDTYFNSQWGLHNEGQTGGISGASVNAQEAWDIATGDGNVIVAVIDTGAELSHDDLKDNIWKNQGEDWINGSPGNNGVDDDHNGKVDDYFGWDFINNDNDPSDEGKGHGTHVAGIVAARGNNGIGVTGLAWRASIMVLKILTASGSGFVSDELDAIDYAIRHGAKIINMSFGGSGYSRLEYEAILAAQEAGVLVVAAAGNTGQDIDVSAIYPAAHGISDDIRNIISVTATDDNDELASFSNYGRLSVDVAAPGVSIYSTSRGNSYRYLSGSSMATPFVSGLAALLLAAHPGGTYTQVRDSILDGVDRHSSLAGKVATGGRINAATSLELLAGPGHLTAVAMAANRIDLSWAGNLVGEENLTIERRMGPGGEYTQLAKVVAGVTSYSDTGVGEATTYTYRVRADNGTAQGKYSNEATETSFPDAPARLSVRKSSGSGLVLEWVDNSSKETGFSIERKETSTNDNYSRVATVGADVTTYSDSGSIGARTYSYRVGSMDSAGRSNYSQEAQLTAVDASSAEQGSSANAGKSGGGCFVSAVAFW